MATAKSISRGEPVDDSRLGNRERPYVADALILDLIVAAARGLKHKDPLCRVVRNPDISDRVDSRSSRTAPPGTKTRRGVRASRRRNFINGHRRALRATRGKRAVAWTRSDIEISGA